MVPKGFSEKKQASYGDKGMGSVSFTNLKIDAAGRVVIPAEMRAAMLATPAEPLVAHVVDGELRVVSRAWVARRLDEEAARFKAANPGVSLVDELIADRREEVRLENERWARLEGEAAELRDEKARR